uniref:Uncharacterized protein n=1 Tax=Plectus sambesii TaxID=2011161 RepID=A0A914VQ09_9BILA
MGYSRLIVCILIWTVSFHNQQAHALRCYTCYAEGCRNPSQLECPPFTDNNCFVLARSENDNTPDRMGCARNCNAVTGFGNSNLCSLCATDGCNRDLQGGRGFGGGSSGVGIGSGASSNNGGWNGNNNDGFNGGGIGNGAGVNSGDPYYGNNGNSGYPGNNNPYSGGQNNNGGIGNGAGVNSGDPYYGSNGNNGNNGYQGNNGIGSGAGVNWNDPNREDPYYGVAAQTSSSLLALITLLVIAAFF